MLLQDPRGPTADRLRVNLAQVSYLEGLEHLHKNSIPSAHGCFHDAIALLRTCAPAVRDLPICGALEARLLRALGDTALYQGDTCGAYRCYREAQGMSGDDSVTLSCVYSGLAALALIADDPDEAERYLHEAEEDDDISFRSRLGKSSCPNGTISRR